MTILIDLTEYIKRKHTFRVKVDPSRPQVIFFVCDQCSRHVSFDRYVWDAMVREGHTPDYSAIPDTFLKCPGKKEQ